MFQCGFPLREFGVLVPFSISWGLTVVFTAIQENKPRSAVNGISIEVKGVNECDGVGMPGGGRLAGRSGVVDADRSGSEVEPPK
jgi:hypothetical protein